MNNDGPYLLCSVYIDGKWSTRVGPGKILGTSCLDRSSDDDAQIMSGTELLQGCH